MNIEVTWNHLSRQLQSHCQDKFCQLQQGRLLGGREAAATSSAAFAVPEVKVDPGPTAMPSTRFSLVPFPPRAIAEWLSMCLVCTREKHKRQLCQPTASPRKRRAGAWVEILKNHLPIRVSNIGIIGAFLCLEAIFLPIILSPMFLCWGILESWRFCRKGSSGTPGNLGRGGLRMPRSTHGWSFCCSVPNRVM